MSTTAVLHAARAAVFPRGLVRVCSQNQRRLWGLSFARLYGIGIGVSYATLTLVGPASLDTASKLWLRSLATASWLAGLGALSLATDLRSRDDAQGVSSLVRLRGYGETELERARVVAGAVRLGRAVLTPGLMVTLAALAKLHSLRAALAALAMAALTLPYAAIVGGVLAPLARACQQLLPSRGRWLFAAVTLGPWALGLGIGEELPSIPAAFAWILTQLGRSFAS